MINEPINVLKLKGSIFVKHIATEDKSEWIKQQMTHTIVTDQININHDGKLLKLSKKNRDTIIKHDLAELWDRRFGSKK